MLLVLFPLLCCAQTRQSAQDQFERERDLILIRMRSTAIDRKEYEALKQQLEKVYLSASRYGIGGFGFRVMNPKFEGIPDPKPTAAMEDDPTLNRIQNQIAALAEQLGALKNEWNNLQSKNTKMSPNAFALNQRIVPLENALARLKRAYEARMDELKSSEKESTTSETLTKVRAAIITSKAKLKEMEEASSKSADDIASLDKLRGIIAGLEQVESELSKH